jgi:hypothetical protein
MREAMYRVSQRYKGYTFNELLDMPVDTFMSLVPWEDMKIRPTKADGSKTAFAKGEYQQLVAQEEAQKTQAAAIYKAMTGREVEDDL